MQIQPSTNQLMNNEPKTKSITPLTILETTDYDAFKGIIGNRPVYKPHLVRLIDSIQRENMLKQNPIIVNEQMEVVDGQHRLMAAKALGLPVYYVIRENAQLAQVQMLNTNNRSWLTQDYLDSYVAQGKRDYIILQDFADEFNISIAIAINILAGEYQSRSKVMRAFREGKFEIKDMSHAANMASFLVEIRKYSPDSAWVDRNLMQALELVLQKVDPKIVIRRLEDYSLRVTRRVSVKEYLAELQDIVNYNQQTQVSLF